jgi:hypothetical protein
MYLDLANNKSGKSIQSVPTFEDGGDPPEALCDWHCHIDDLLAVMKIDDEEKRFNSSHQSYKATIWIVFKHTKLSKKLLMTNERNLGMMKMYCWGIS